MKTQRRFLTAIFLTGFCWLCGASLAQADPVLLGQWEIFLSGGGISKTQNLDYHDIASTGSIEFGLGYDIQNSPQPKPLGVCIGCDLSIPLSSLLKTNYEFDASNTPDFVSFAAELTDGAPEILWSLSEIFPTGGGGSGNPDSVFFPTANTWQLDFVMLDVENFAIGPFSQPLCPGCIGPGFEYQTEVKWELWGTGVPDPSASVVPEPSSMLLVAAGLFGIFAMKSRRSRRTT